MPAATKPPFALRARDLGALIGIGLGQAASLVALVLLIRTAVDRLQATPFDAADLVPVVIGLTAVAVALSLLRGLEFALSEAIGFEYVRALRLYLYDHLQGMTPRQVASRSRGGIVLRFTGDLSTLRTWVSRGMARGIVSALVLVAGIGVTTALNLATGLALLGVLLLGAALSLRAGTTLRRRTRTARRRRSLLTSNVVEQVGSLAVVQAFGRGPGERSRFERHNASMTDALKRAAGTRATLRATASATALLGLVIVVGVGAFELERGRTDVSSIIATVTAIRYLTGPVRTLGLSHDYWQGAQVSKAKLRDFLKTPAMDLDAPGLERLRVRRGEIALHDVSVDGALQSVDLTIPGGSFVALTGPNGAGKSTLLSVIARFVDPDAGTVSIDGSNLAECTRRSIYRHLGIVSADLPLMSGTLRRNLTYRYRDVTDEELERVILTCRIDEILETLPNGLDTWLQEGGQNLSLGHRQRVTLARATLGSPRILLLDEPTGNLDDATKEVFRRVLAAHAGTIVLATHDPAEAALADTVVRLEAGRLVRTWSGADYRLWRYEHERSSIPARRW